ncbi:hypothetical protein ACXR2U_04870 [Jatrophihabitans sp. YIM 134969]
MRTLTTDDHTCVLLLDDVVLRQVLGLRDADERAMLLRLNLAANNVPSFDGRLIGRGRHAARHAATAADRARHPSAGRHAATPSPAPAPAVDARQQSAAA